MKLYRYFQKTLQLLWIALLAANLWVSRSTLLEAVEAGDPLPKTALSDFAAQKADIVATMAESTDVLDLVEVSVRELRQEAPSYGAVEKFTNTVEASFAKKKKEPPPPPPMWAATSEGPGAL